MKLLFYDITDYIFKRTFMFTIQNKDNYRIVIATKNILKDTVLFDEEIKYMIDKKVDNWYELLIEYELTNNSDIFLDLVPHINDRSCICDGVFNKISATIIKPDLQLMYNKIIRNAFNVKLNNKQYATILYRGRMFNHSCCPNVLFKLVRNKNKYYMRFYVCKNIMKGEELNDNYFDTNLPYAKRQHIAKTFYGFVCKCNKCVKFI
jgi:hypothetical protein